MSTVEMSGELQLCVIQLWSSEICSQAHSRFKFLATRFKKKFSEFLPSLKFSD